MLDQSVKGSALTPQAIEFLESRNLDVETCLRYGLISSADGKAIAIPSFQAGEVVGCKYRALGEKTFWQDKGSRQIFWNEDALRDDTLAACPVVITEGEFDALAALQCGFPRTVSVPGGAPKEAIGEKDPEKDQKYAYLREARALLEQVPEIIVAADGDDKGANLLNDLAVRIGKARVKWVQYPWRRDRSRRCKDLNETLQEYGHKGVTSALNKAGWMKLDGVYRLDELPPIPPRRGYRNTFPYNPQTGQGLCERYLMRECDFVVLTGIPSSGKSTFIADLYGGMALDHGWVTVIASFEATPQEDFRRMLRTRYWGAAMNTSQDARYNAGLNSDLTGPRLEIEMSDAHKVEADAWINRHFLFLIPDEDEQATVAWLLEKARDAILRYSANALVVDPWNEIDHDRDMGMSQTEYTGEAIKHMKKFANKYRVHLMVAAHPAKLRPQKPGDAIPIPTLYDVSDSQHWYNKADVGIIIHTQLDDSGVTRTLIRVAKTRFHDKIGAPGDEYLYFWPREGRYRLDPAPGAEKQIQRGSVPI